MSTANIVVLIHGITTYDKPGDHSHEYGSLLGALKASSSWSLIDAVAEVEWGHEPVFGVQTDDQKLFRAEQFLQEVSSPATLAKRPGYQQAPADLISRWALRRATDPIKSLGVIAGLGDALYYCSPDGEKAIRRSVYQQVIKALDSVGEHDHYKIHIVAQSLGVAVSLDFLYGLFSPADQLENGTPGFVTQFRDEASMFGPVLSYREWRRRAGEGRLKLGSLSTTGGQLPIMMLRKQALVDRLAEKKLLDASVYGVRGNRLKWQNIFDRDDVLGYPSAGLFPAGPYIRDVEVNTGWHPQHVHNSYWLNPTVQRHITQLISANL